MKTYEMPTIRPGQTVLWYGSRTGTEPSVAIVVAVATEMVDLLVLPPGSANGLPRGGVRHRDDPNQRAIDNSEMGVWDFTQADHDGLETMTDLAQLISAQERLLLEMGKRIRASEQAIEELQRLAWPQGATPMTPPPPFPPPPATEPAAGKPAGKPGRGVK